MNQARFESRLASAHERIDRAQGGYNFKTGVERWENIGVAAAMIDGGRSDFRDLIVLLILMRFAAELSGMDTKPFFDRAIQDTDESMAPILKNVQDHKQKDVRCTVQSFGGPEWISHSFEIL